jgi:hypothetical protein
MPQNRLDRAVQTLHLNATMKAGNKSIDVCHKSNSKKTWSDSPTSKYFTDPCESMLQTEWRLSTAWTPHRVSQYRWLLTHSANEECSDETSEDEDSLDTDNNSEDSSDPSEDSSDNSSEVGDNDVGGSSSKKLSLNAFGPIPRFFRVYEVTVEQTSQVFLCTLLIPRLRMRPFPRAFARIRESPTKTLNPVNHSLNTHKPKPKQTRA